MPNGRSDGKVLLQLSDQSVDLLGDYPEAGMGFYGFRSVLLKGWSNQQVNVVVAGPYYTLFGRHPEYYSLSDIIEGRPLPREVINIEVEGFPSEVVAESRADVFTWIPEEYRGEAGAIELVGRSVLSRDTVMYRFLSDRDVPDPRFERSNGRESTGSLETGTYLTTYRDRRYVNTGFAAVGRFALPLPLPASRVYEYVIPEGTNIKVGTVLPGFGQSGGGVEIQLPSNVKNVRQAGPHEIADY